MVTFSDGSMATAFTSGNYPYAAFFDSSGNHLPNSPIQLANNATFTYVISCKVNDDSILVVMSKLNTPI